MIHYTPEQIEFLKKYIPGHSHKEIAEEFSRRYVRVTDSQIKSFCNNHKIRTGHDGRFKKGHSSWNKGKHMPIRGRMRETMFKAGNKPHNHRPVGSERINVEGYIEVKTKEPNTWKFKHRLVYREHFGEIPEGCIVTFKDGNKLNLSPDNLAAISRAEHAKLNRVGLRRLGAEAFDTALLIAKIQLESGRRKEGINGTQYIPEEERDRREALPGEDSSNKFSSVLKEAR